MKQPVPDEVILGLLRAQPMHGYLLLEKFHSKGDLGRVWTMSTSQAYAVLRRLEERGLIKGEAISVPDAPSKIVYSITTCGNQILEDWLFEDNPPSSIHLLRVIFISRLYIASILGKDKDLIIAKQIEVVKRQLNYFQAEREKQLSEIEGLTVDFIIGQLGAALNWLKKTGVDKNWPNKN